MYGIEPATGLGGLAAQATGGNQYLPGALAISSRTSGRRGGPIVGGSSVLPQSFGQTVSGLGPQISVDGTAVERSPSLQMGGWREILDFHNSPAPWILALLLVIYAWTHISYRARGAAELGIARR